MFLVSRSNERDRAVEAWREAAQLVSARWAVFLEAGAQSRKRAFASYVAALDAEEAAADAIAHFAARDCRQSAYRALPEAA
jgi:hypothetical protein